MSSFVTTTGMRKKWQGAVHAVPQTVRQVAGRKPEQGNIIDT